MPKQIMVKCPKCGLQMRTEDIPDSCRINGCNLDIESRAKLANRILVERINDQKGAAQGIMMNRIEQIHNKMKSCDSSHLYSDSVGVYPIDNMLDLMEKIGLAVEKKRGSYELNRSPPGPLESLMGKVPRFGGLREAVERQAEKEVGRRPTFMYSDGKAIDKDAVGWPDRYLEIPHKDTDETEKNTTDMNIRDRDRKEKEDTENRNYEDNCRKVTEIIADNSEVDDVVRKVKNEWDERPDHIYLKQNRTLGDFIVDYRMNRSFEEVNRFTRKGDIRSAIRAQLIKEEIERRSVGFVSPLSDGANLKVFAQALREDDKIQTNRPVYSSSIDDYTVEDIMNSMTRIHEGNGSIAEITSTAGLRSAIEKIM